MADELMFKDQVVIVTGGGNGLGRAYALEFARRGARVVVNDLGGGPDGKGGSEAPAAKVVEEILKAGGEAVANFDSVASQEGGESIVKTALDKWGRLDSVISNAGILRDRSFVKLSVEELDAVLDVHLRGAFFVLQPAFRAMKDAGNGGRLVLTSSASGLYGNFGQTNYAAAKMGLVGLTRVISIEGERYNIKANAIAPIAGTRLTRGESGDSDDADSGSPRRVTPLVVALAHPSCPTTGEIFNCGGNWFARTYMALCPGWLAEDSELNAEGVLANFDRIRDSSRTIELTKATDLNELEERKRS